MPKRSGESGSIPTTSSKRSRSWSTERRPGGDLMTIAELELADWRRRVNDLYASVRSTHDPKEGHELWRSGRNALFLDHPQSPLRAGDSLRETGIPYWP